VARKIESAKERERKKEREGFFAGMVRKAQMALRNSERGEEVVKKNIRKRKPHFRRDEEQQLTKGKRRARPNVEEGLREKEVCCMAQKGV